MNVNPLNRPRDPQAQPIEPSAAGSLNNRQVSQLSPKKASLPNHITDKIPSQASGKSLTGRCQVFKKTS